MRRSEQHTRAAAVTEEDDYAGLVVREDQLVRPGSLRTDCERDRYILGWRGFEGRELAIDGLFYVERHAGIS